MNYSRYALFYTPPPGTFALAGAAWLGWDSASGKSNLMPNLDYVARPRKYGFHATVKAPFALAPSATPEELKAAVGKLCLRSGAVALGDLQFAWLGRFLALIPVNQTNAMTELAADCVKELDFFRAQLSDHERRRKERPDMSPDLKKNLQDWGYPYTMEAYRFHITLTGKLESSQQNDAQRLAERHFKSALPNPLVLDGLTLMGEDSNGMFRAIERFELQGQGHI